MESATPLPLRGDNILGVCQAIGEDFGFNPLWLRILLATGMVWNPLAMVGVYFALGAVVLLSRLLFPARRTATAVEAAPSEAPATTVTAIEETREPELIAA